MKPLKRVIGAIKIKNTFSPKVASVTRYSRHSPAHIYMCVCMCFMHCFIVHTLSYSESCAVLYFAPFPKQHILKVSLCSDWDLLRTKSPWNFFAFQNLAQCLAPVRPSVNVWLIEHLITGHTSFPSYLHVRLSYSMASKREVQSYLVPGTLRALNKRLLED